MYHEYTTFMSSAKEGDKMTDHLSIGPSPAEEKCESLGRDYDPIKARLECKRFINLIRKTTLSEDHSFAAAESGVKKITGMSHLDHGLSERLVKIIAEKYADRQAFFIDTFEIPSDHPTLPCALIEGVPEFDCFYRQRKGRSTWSRLCRRPPSWSSVVTVVGGPSGDEPCVLYTAYGGKLAPREPGDPGIKTSEEAAESFRFWWNHALSAEAVGEA